MEALQEEGVSTEAETSPLLPPAAAPGGVVAVPVAALPAGVPSEPMVVRSSLKATMNLMSGSYSRWVGVEKGRHSKHASCMISAGDRQASRRGVRGVGGGVQEGVSGGCRGGGESRAGRWGGGRARTGGGGPIGQSAGYSAKLVIMQSLREWQVSAVTAVVFSFTSGSCLSE